MTSSSPHPGSGLSGSKSVRPGVRVELRDLHRRFGVTRALNGFSLTIEPGELVALLGPSGCGKTTALRVLAGFETLDSGQVVLDGEDIGAKPAQRRDMGMVFQSYSLFPNMSAVENVGFGLRMRRVSTAERGRRARELLDVVGLASETDKHPHQMSGGQQQRVALARALAIEPRVLLLDEPLSALDAKVRLQLRDQIRVLQTCLGITTVFVTHDQEEALSMADRVCVMRSGQIEQVAAPAELYSRPATAFVAEFVGTMNRLPGRVVRDGVEVFGGRAAIRNPAGFSLGAAVDVLIRPEGLQMEVADRGRGIVTTKTFLGSITRVSVLAEDTMIQIDQPSDVAARVDPGTAVDIVLVDAEVMITEPRGGNTVPVATLAASEQSAVDA